MDFSKVKSLSILGKAVKTLFIGGKKVWSKAAPYVPVPNSYIETDGVGSYMDLGFIPTESTTYEIDYVLFPRDGKTVGYMMGASEGRYIQFAIGSGNAITYNVTRPTISFQPSASSERHVLKYDGSKIAFDGKDYALAYPPYAARSVTMRLGDDGRSLFANCRIYAAKYWENGVLIRNLVPYTGERGVGLLDLVHDVLYTNAGTGALTYGIDQPYDYELDWVQTDGAASYFDLGFVPNTQGTSLEANVMVVKLAVEETSGACNGLWGACTGPSKTADLSYTHAMRWTSSRGYSNFFAYPTATIHSDDERHYSIGEKVNIVIDNENKTIAVNGKSAVFTNTVEKELANLCLGTSYPGEAKLFCGVRFYSFHCWNSNGDIRDLIPVMKDGVPGLWDKVEGKFYSNAGSGTIVAGPRKGKTPYVETLCQTDSFWAAAMDQLGCIVAPAEPQHFAFAVDMRFDDGYNPEGDYGIFGFTKCNLLYNQNMQSASATDLSVYAYAPGSVINVNGHRQLVTPGARRVITFDFDPSVGTSVDVDGSVSSYAISTTLKVPYDTSFKFGGNATTKTVTSVSKPVRMRVYGIKIYQFHNLVADLVPYQDGDVVGMADAVSGMKFPGSNLEYGEE